MNTEYPEIYNAAIEEAAKILDAKLKKIVNIFIYHHLRLLVYLHVLFHFFVNVPQ